MMASKYMSMIYLIVLFYCSNSEDFTAHPGHLKPIGSHGKILDVESKSYFPGPSFFFQNHVFASKPLIIRGGAKISPAFSLWTDEYFLNFEEGKKVIVVVEQAKKENRTLSPEEIPFNDFVRRYSKEDIYLVNDVPQFLSKDVFLPPSLCCPELVDNFLLAKLMWFSSGGTKSVLHYDSAENINCLFAGTKKLYLIDPNKYSEKVTIENKKAAYSNVDVERVDFVKYPGLAQVEYHYVEMQPGDCLYIPYGWYHHVSSVGRNLAVNIWWSASAKPHLPDCNLPNTTLEKCTFFGFETLYPREAIDALKSALKSLFELHGSKINMNDFCLSLPKSDFFEPDAIWSDDMMGKVDQLFNYLDEPSHDAQLTPDDITSLSEKTWENVFHVLKELSALVDDQFEQDSDEDDNSEPEDANQEDLKEEL